MWIGSVRQPDLERAIDTGKIGAMLTLEGADALEGDLSCSIMLAPARSSLARPDLERSELGGRRRDGTAQGGAYAGRAEWLIAECERTVSLWTCLICASRLLGVAVDADATARRFAFQCLCDLPASAQFD